MKYLTNLAILAAGIIPTFSFIIPDETVANQVFLDKGHKSSASRLRESTGIFEKLEDTFEAKLNDILDEFDKLTKPEKSYGIKDAVAVSEASILDAGFDSFYGLKGVQLFPQTYEYFDGEAWLSHYRQSADALFANFPYEELSCNSGRGAHGHHDHHDHQDHSHNHQGHSKRPPMPPHDPGRPHTDSTLFDIISKSKHTTMLFDLIKKDNDLVNMLKDPKANLTIFAPGNEAFKRLPEDPKDVPKDLVKRILTYHIAQGTHDSNDLVHHNTILTKLCEGELGKGMHQRLRLGFGHHGPTVNYYSRITMVDVYAKNGVIHGIDSLLIPPPSALELIEILPTEFSTSEAALFRSGLIDELRKQHDGLTIFLPSNLDWQKLGFAVNAFLFSDKGNDYLKAIMKYHIVPGHTLYSDAYVVPNKKKVANDEDDPSGLPHGFQHVDLPTLLKDRCISVDITRYERFLSFRVNGLNTIIVSDGITKNGVIQVPNHVLIPPHTEDEHRHPPKGISMEDTAEITVEELKARLAPFVNTEKEL